MRPRVRPEILIGDNLPLCWTELQLTRTGRLSGQGKRIWVQQSRVKGKAATFQMGTISKLVHRREPMGILVTTSLRRDKLSQIPPSDLATLIAEPVNSEDAIKAYKPVVR